MPFLAGGARALGALLNRTFGLAAVVTSLFLVSVVGACGSSPSVTSKGTAGGNALGDAGNEALGGSSGDDGSMSMGDELNVGANNGVGGAGVPVGVTELKLEVTIDKDLVLATGTPIDVAAHAQYEDGTLPKSVIWSVDDTKIGSISQDGVFEANGYSAGAVTITAQAGSESASVPFAVAVKLKPKSPDNVSAADQALLIAGGSGGSAGIGPDAAFRFLYPYDNTVFPRGLLAPVLQFGGAAARLGVSKDHDHELLLYGGSARRWHSHAHHLAPMQCGKV